MLGICWHLEAFMYLKEERSGSLPTPKFQGFGRDNRLPSNNEIPSHIFSTMENDGC